MDKFDRIARLRAILEHRRTPIALKELARRMECSESTARRTLDLYRDHCGAPVVYDRQGGGWRLDTRQGERTIQLPGLWFTPDELHALLSANELLRQIELGLLAREVAPLTERIRQILERKGLSLSAVAQRVRLMPIGARQAPTPVFATIAQGLLQRCRLSFGYHPRGHAEDAPAPAPAVPARQVSPQRLVWYRSNWYLQAWCHQVDDFRCFALERIQDPRIDADAVAAEIDAAALEAHFDASYGIFGGPATECAVLRFQKRRARWVAEECWHPRQEGLTLPDGRYELRIPYSQPQELAMDILRYGPDVEVIAPESLRLTVRRMLGETLEKYL